MYVLIAGGGKAGANVMRTLLRNGHEATLIEQERDRFERLEPDVEGEVGYVAPQLAGHAVPCPAEGVWDRRLGFFRQRQAATLRRAATVGLFRGVEGRFGRPKATRRAPV